MENIFEKAVTDTVIDRINVLSVSTERIWGSMTPAQTLAHCNVTYEMVFESEKHKKSKGLLKFIVKTFVKPIVVGDKPYSKNGKTASAFKITNEKDFDSEKKRLVDFILKTQKLGTDYFDNKESHSFGPLSIPEWNNMFYKHLDHHLKQFGC